MKDEIPEEPIRNIPLSRESASARKTEDRIGDYQVYQDSVFFEDKDMEEFKPDQFSILGSPNVKLPKIVKFCLQITL